MGKQIPFSSVLAEPSREPASKPYRLAAAILGASVLSNLLYAVLATFGDRSPTYLPMVIDLFLAVFLLRGSERAANLILARAFLGSVVWPVFLLVQYGFNVSVVVSILVEWGLCAPLILLLLGESTKKRIRLALILFFVFFLLPQLGFFFG